MIPSRDEIERWLVTMRDEIDRLMGCNESALNEQAGWVAKAERAEETISKLREIISQGSLDHNKAINALAKAGWTRDGSEWKPPIGPNPSPLLEQLDKLRAELDAAWRVSDERVTRLRSSLIDIGTQVGSLLSDKVSNEFLCLVKDEVRSHLANLRKELDAARDALAKATTAPSEGEIAAWEGESLAEQTDQVNPSGEPSEFDTFIVLRREIETAVALMRRAATASDAKLRELRAWMVDKARMQLHEGFGWSFEVGHINLSSVVRRIDELLAAPAKPAEPAEPAESAPGCDDGRACMLCGGSVPSGQKGRHGVGVCVVKMEPADDTRELVAALASLLASKHDPRGYMHPDYFHQNLEAIAAKLRGGK